MQISKAWRSWKIKCNYILINLSNILINYLRIPQVKIEVHAKETK